MTERNESEYQDLIEEFLARGGKITRCEDGKAEGALELDKRQGGMDGFKPGSPEGWDLYFDMEHLNQRPVSATEQVNQIKRTVEQVKRAEK